MALDAESEEQLKTRIKEELVDKRGAMNATVVKKNASGATKPVCKDLCPREIRDSANVGATKLHE